MLNTIKYSFLRALRNKEHVISSVAISLLMGTMFFFMTDTMLDELIDGSITLEIGVVQVAGEDEHATFLDILDAAGALFEIQMMEMDEALYALENDEIYGIFEIGNELNLLVVNDGFRQIIMQQFADSYLQHHEILMTILATNPAYFDHAMMSILAQTPVMSEKEMANEMPDMIQNLAITMIAITSVIPFFQGFDRALKVNNDGKIGSRRIISSFGKMNMLIGDLIGVAVLQVILTMITWAYFAFVLGINIEASIPLSILAFFIASAFSVAFGAFLGLVAPGKEKTREQILNVVVMIGAFAAGMSATIRGIAVVDAINTVNPFVLIADAVLALTLDNMPRYIGFISTIAGATVVLLAITFITLRRNRHVDLK